MAETILVDPRLAVIESARLVFESAAEQRGWQVQVGFEPGHDPLAQIIDMQPILIVVLDDPLPTWIAAVRANPATRRLPVVTIGQTETLSATARDLGIQHTLSLAMLDAEALLQVARPLPNPKELADDCAQPLSELALKGLHEFNAHDFFEAHETLETAWKAEHGPARDLYRVVLQVGLAYYQIERGNYHGALKMFLRTRQWFVRLPAQCRGIDLARLRADAEQARIRMEALGPDHISEFDPAFIKPIIYSNLKNGIPSDNKA